MISRRHFLQLGVATLPLPAFADSQDLPAVTLGAGEARAQLLPEKYAQTPVWAYNGSIPGTVLRTRQGHGMSLRFKNGLAEPSTVHWHGIRLENDMDGVSGLTQEPVEPGGHFDYHFSTPDAGTYWYHSHHRSWEQMARGLYGALIVEEREPPVVDLDQVLLIDDWRLQANSEISDDFESMMDRSHGGRSGNWLTVNGVGIDRAIKSVKRNQRVRFRLVNVANASIMSLAFEGLQGWIIAFDGQPLDTPEKLGEIILAPGQRVDVLADIVNENEARLLMATQKGLAPLMRFPVEGLQRETILDPPQPLPANPLATIGSLRDVQITELHMQGGAMSGMQSAVFQGRELGMRELMSEGMVWAFNGVAGMAETPLLTATRNSTVRIRMKNDTSFPHGMHLHGHHFRQVLDSTEQIPTSIGPWRDTLLLDRGEIADIVFVADNPGKWLLHCHMLGHQAAGMKTWVQVT